MRLPWQLRENSYIVLQWTVLDEGMLLKLCLVL